MGNFNPNQPQNAINVHYAIELITEDEDCYRVYDR